MGILLTNSLDGNKIIQPVGLFSYFYPCNNHQELCEKQVQDYCYWWLNPDITQFIPAV